MVTGEWLVLVESNTTGTGQLFAACARRLGLRPMVFTREPDRYPYLAADELDFRVIDTTQPAALSTACDLLSGRIAGITSSSEYFIAPAAELARDRGLPHPDPAAVRICRDKHLQRIRLRQAGVPCPDFAAADTPDAAVALASRIGLPVVVKPVAQSGSIGVRLCANPADVRAAADALFNADSAELALPPQQTVVVEQYLEGVEYSVETLDEQVVGVTRKHLGAHPYFVESGHDFPAPLPAAERAVIGQVAIAALRALGLGWGAAHVELRQTDIGPSIIEVNPRLAGGMIPRIVQESTGVDLIFHVVAKAAGRVEPLQADRTCAAAIRFLVADTAGWLSAIHGVDQARQVPGVVEVGITREKNQQIVLRHSFQDRLGYVIASAVDGDTAARAAEDGLRLIEARITTAMVTTEGSSR